MTLEKLTIKPLPPSKLPKIKALFNPNSYSITKSVTWSSAPTGSSAQAGSTAQTTEVKKNAPTLVFGGGGGRQLTLELFFDVTEKIDGQAIGDVRTKTNDIVKLTRIERDPGQPPVCEVSWGGSAGFFVGVVSQLTQRFTLFRSDGAPVRATLTVVFTEFLNPEDDQKDTDPEFTTRLVKRGDSLSGIAGEIYGDPTLWRLIAEANDVNDPRNLPIGLRLNVPKLG